MATPPVAAARSGTGAGRRAAPWLRPTLRATPWRPLAVVAGTLAAGLALAHGAGSSPAPTTLVGVALGLLVAGGLLGLDDPARDLLAAVPTSLARRRAHRLAVLVPAVAASGGALAHLAREAGVVDAPIGSLAGSLLALGAMGLLVARLAERRRPELTAAAGAGAAVTWVLVAAAGPASGVLGALAHGWTDRPWPWAAAAVAAWLVAGRGQPA